MFVVKAEVEWLVADPLPGPMHLGTNVIVAFKSAKNGGIFNSLRTVNSYFNVMKGRFFLKRLATNSSCVHK